MKILPIEQRKRALEDIKILAETGREPFLILDFKLRVIEANTSFFKVFRVNKKEILGKYLYRLGNQQWNITKLKLLLEEILPKKKIMEDFEVVHKFPKIGKRIMLLNARQLDSVQLIILAFEDITQRKTLEKKSKDYTKRLEKEVAKRTKELSEKVKDLEELTQVMVGRELKMSELKKEIARIKKLKKINGNNGNGNGL